MQVSGQRGFTLIELVVVIVVLGILAAFAVPRFMGLERQARVASLNALAGSIRSGAAMAHGVWLAQGGVGNVAAEGGGNLVMVNGYPNRNTVDNMLQDIAGFTYVPGTGRFTPAGARDPANCWLQYNEATAAAPYQIQFSGNAAQLRANC